MVYRNAIYYQRPAHFQRPSISRKSNRITHFGELGLLFSRLFLCISRKRQLQSAFWEIKVAFLARNEDVLQEKGNPNWFFREIRLPFRRNPGCFSEKRQPQKLISKKRVAFPSEHITAPWIFAGRRAGVPLWPVGCPMPQGGGEVKSWRRVVDRKGNVRGQPRSGAEVAVANGSGRRSTLYFTERPAAPAPAGRKIGSLDGRKRL